MNARRQRAVLLVIAALLATTVGLSATTAHAGAPPCSYPTPALAPTSGPAGTTVVVTAPPDPGQCVPRPDPEWGYRPFVTLGFEPDTPASEAIDVADVNPDGSWELAWTVPEGFPTGEVLLYPTLWIEYEGVALAAADEGPDLSAQPEMVEVWIEHSYAGLPFTVTTPPTTTTTTTSAPLPAPSIVLSKTEVVQGESFEVKATGFAPGAEVEIYLESTPVLLATAVADQVGSIAVNVTVPIDFAVGAHTVRAVGLGAGGEVLNLSAGITVGAAAGAVTTAAPTTVAAAPVSATGTLPRTGGDPLPLALIALGLLVVGGTVLVTARRVRA